MVNRLHRWTPRLLVCRQYYWKVFKKIDFSGSSWLLAGFKKIVRDQTVRAQFVRVQTKRRQTVRVQKCTKSTLKCTRLAVYETGSVRVESVQVRLCDFEVYEN